MGFPAGQTRTDVDKAKIADGLSLAYREGRRPRGHSEETKRKMSAQKRALHDSGWRSPSAKRQIGDRYVEGRYGYTMICTPNRRDVPEHRHVAEQALGRPLRKTEVVHHVNGNKSDNRNSNLVVCTREYHSYLHQKMSELYQKLVFGEGENGICISQ